MIVRLITHETIISVCRQIRREKEAHVVTVCLKQVVDDYSYKIVTAEPSLYLFTTSLQYNRQLFIHKTA